MGDEVRKLFQSNRPAYLSVRARSDADKSLVAEFKGSGPTRRDQFPPPLTSPSCSLSRFSPMKNPQRSTRRLSHQERQEIELRRRAKEEEDLARAEKEEADNWAWYQHLGGKSLVNEALAAKELSLEPRRLSETCLNPKMECVVTETALAE